MYREERRTTRDQVALPALPSAVVPQAHDLDWSWPPYAPLELAAVPFDTPEWAPASTVWHPQLRVGRWTVLYRRGA
ncbi:hypothetical protein SAMN05661080_00695 [Modestobacter sp. DSM 44400]|uniref:hypothetical protein n=1 Tax=Modestobacter sp. DSM 44400 TaxID=1550230 RepID=UPI0008999F7C|nr:hypothetical protein [Modestobacter sp. DSM 44400]SDX65445.1 hypothetical protein SAMN05661080_00695 [Modestobacter sp. DSM 44400]